MRKRVILKLLRWFLIWLLTRFRNSKLNGLDLTNLMTLSSGQGGAEIMSKSHGLGFIGFHLWFSIFDSNHFSWKFATIYGLQVMNHSFEIIRDIFARARISRAWSDWTVLRTGPCFDWTLLRILVWTVIFSDQTPFWVTAHYWSGKFVGRVWNIAKDGESDNQNYY